MQLTLKTNIGYHFVSSWKQISSCGAKDQIGARAPRFEVSRKHN